jgi:hypothetical protein
MLLFGVIFLLYAILSSFFEFFKKFELVKLISLAFGSGLFFLITFGVSDNSDWEIYESFFEGYRESTDFLFSFISNQIADLGYDYSIVYKIHILLMSFGFIYFSSRKSYSAVFIVLSSYLLIHLVPISNQIRYYLAFSFFLITIYNFLVLKNKKISIIFLILSLLSHAGIILLYGFLYFFYFVDEKKYIQKVAFYSVITGGIFFFLFFLGFVFSTQFAAYFSDLMLSSFFGGIFNNLLWIIWMLYLIGIHKKNIQINETILIKDAYYNFIYKLSFFPFIFIIVSFIIQIFAHRYIASFLIVWVCYVLYSLSLESDSKKRFNSLLTFFLMILTTVFYIYFLPEFLIDTSGTEAVMKILKSNSFILPYIL